MIDRSPAARADDRGDRNATGRDRARVEGAARNYAADQAFYTRDIYTIYLH